MSDGAKKPKPQLVGERMETCELDRAKMSLMNPKVISEKVEERTIDELAKKTIEHCLKEGIETVWDRSEMQEPHCKWCSTGLSCSRCTMGPCRIIPERNRVRGVCGADADLIVARNLLDMCATGAASHSDHGREIAETLLLVGKGESSDYSIKDTEKLFAIAEEYNIPTDRAAIEVAHDLALAFLEEFGTIKGELELCRRAPEATYAIWEQAGILPRGIDREIVEAMHRVHMGVGAQYANMLLHGFRAALGDGWGGSMIGTEVSDILFGTPTPVESMMNLGVIKEDQVNITLHGHNPMLSEMIVEAAESEAMQAMAKKNGATGINLIGLCCTGNELLMRRGIPMAGNHFNQELVIATGALDAMIVDYQCIFPSLPRTASCFHTKVISTSPKSKIPGSYHVEFSPENARAAAEVIVQTAVENFKNREPEKIFIPGKPVPVTAGFSVEAITAALGGTLQPLIDAIASGKIRGAVGIVGCNNPKIKHDYGHVTLAKELIKHDILCVETGCAAVASGKAGLLTPDACFLAGDGLKGICKAVGIPPVLHMGSCVDCSRILVLLAALGNALGVGIHQLPVAGAAPEWYSPKAVTIGSYFVASGVYTVLGPMPNISGSPAVVDLLTNGLEGVVNAKFAVEPDPVKAAELIINHIEEKRKALGI